jgi:hypothetical protein
MNRLPANDPDWLTLSQATALTGLAKTTIHYHARQGHIRSRQTVDPARFGSTFPRRLFFFDDVRVLSWSRSGAVADHLATDSTAVSGHLRRWQIDGVRWLGGRWRINPARLQAIINWWQAGRPVRSGFRPRFEEGP